MDCDCFRFCDVCKYEGSETPECLSCANGRYFAPDTLQCKRRCPEGFESSPVSVTGADNTEVLVDTCVPTILGLLRQMGVTGLDEQLFYILVFWGADDELTGRDIADWPAVDACTNDCPQCCNKVCTGLLPEPIEVPLLSRLTVSGPFGPEIRLKNANFCVEMRTDGPEKGVFGFNHGFWQPINDSSYTFDWLAVQNPIQGEVLNIIKPHDNSTNLPLSALELARFFAGDTRTDEVQFAADAIGLDLDLMVSNPELVMRSPIPAFKVSREKRKKRWRKRE